MNAFDFNLNLYKFIDIIWSAIGFVLSSMPFIYTIRVFGKSDEEKIKVVKQSKVIFIIWVITVTGLLVVKHSQIFNVEDVFSGDYLYVGQTVNGMASGKGKKYDLNENLIYEGDFRANQYRGDGRLYNYILDENGENIGYLQYEGKFVDGLCNGYGKFYRADSALDADDPVLEYEGMFADNKMSGNGIYYYSPDKDGNVWRYEGEFADGKYNGRGKMYFNDQLSYEGRYADSKMNGIGVYYYQPDENGNVYRYEGEFADDRYNGKGKMYLNDRLSYEGEYEDGRRSGAGVYYFSPDENGNVYRYEGEFENDRYNGEGKMYFNDQLIYEGEYVDNYKSGKGIQYNLPDENGDVYRYEGEFANGLYSGEGKMYLNDQLIYEGKYIDGHESGLFLNLR